MLFRSPGWATSPATPSTTRATTPPVSVSAAVPSASSPVTVLDTSAQVDAGGGQAAEVVDHPSSTVRPLDDHPADEPPVTTEDGSDPGAPAEPDDPMLGQVRSLLDQVRPPDQPPGRRTVARELGISPYRASQLLAAATSAAPTTSNGGPHKETDAT